MQILRRDKRDSVETKSILSKLANARYLYNFSQLRKHTVYGTTCTNDDLFGIRAGNGVWRCEEEVIANLAISAALRREEAHIIAFLEAAHAHATCDVELGVERGFGRFAGNEFDGPEEATTWEE